MGSRLKEDEKNERSIRALLKLSENRKCINCGSLGPQYVCTNFSIFVCTSCSGLHREFTHRVKSVSMAKFTAEEVKSLQAGGNERGREVFFKDFDFSRNPLPDSSNPDKLRDFIKAVYVDRRYSGERALPRKNLPGDREDSYGRSDVRASPRDVRSGYDIRSPCYEDCSDDQRFPQGRRSDADGSRYDDRRDEDRVVRFEEKRSPSRVDLDPRTRNSRGQFDDREHDDRRRYEERVRERRKSYDERLANGSHYGVRRFADDRNLKDFACDSPPVRPVSDILGESIPTLWVEEYRHTNGRDAREIRDDDDRSSLDSPASSSNSDNRRESRISRLGSFGGANGSSNSVNTVSIKRASSGSLIDFSAEAEPAPVSTSSAPASGSGISGDGFVVSADVGPQTQPSAASSSSTGWAVFDLLPAAASARTRADAPPTGYPDVYAAPGHRSQWDSARWSASQSAHAAAHSAASENETWVTLMGPTTPSAQSGLVQEQVETSALAALATSLDRSRELPQELFSSPIPPSGGFGIRHQLPGLTPPVMPYDLMGAVPGFDAPARSRNPFDLPAESGSSGGGTFPGMASLQAALPIGTLSMPGLAAPTLTNQWSLGPQHASYPKRGSAGVAFMRLPNFSPPSPPPVSSPRFYGVNAYAQLPATIGAQAGMSAPSAGPSLGLSDYGSYNSLPRFGAGQSFMGPEMPDFTAPDSVRPVGGNPFG
ncbi:hypothetical protein R1sor_009238 [Riccia sorocarpa]|uniref:Arf-GAP domain-containing protein n=1 Tax=Riccia sorocarpa TaxID=122646 RepID=A0ABD3H939_9MARC